MKKINEDVSNVDNLQYLTELKNQFDAIHFIGISGIGMGGLALIFHKLGFNVTGSDLHLNNISEYLKSLNINIKIGPHKATNLEHLPQKSLVVVTSAIQKNNPEYQYAKDLGLVTIKRAALLAKVLDCGLGIAITGTHGKTTTTSIVTNIFKEAKLDPTYAIGGVLTSTGLNADLGSGSYVIIEADESDATLKFFSPKVLVINNIDADHLINYNNDLSELENYIVDFINSLPEDSIIILNKDDTIIEDKIIPKLKDRQLITFGESEDSDYRLINFSQKANEVLFDVKIRNKNKVSFTLPMPGRHNALNAVASFCIAESQGIEHKYVKSAIANFSGVGRRFQNCGDITIDNKNVTLIDDYGHHPKEILATIEAVKAGWPERRMVLAYQPHKYSRTKDLFDDFVKALSNADKLLLLPVYSANEELIPGSDSESLYNALIKYNNNLDIDYIDYDIFLDELDGYVKDNDILVMQGAGDISNLISALKDY